MGKTSPPTVQASMRDFIYKDGPEPHAKRRAEILKKHPEMKKLFGHEWRTKYIVAGTVALQIFLAWATLEWRWPAYIACVYLVGATANHSLFLAIHEFAHNLGACKPEHNKLLGMFANLPLAIPSSITFKPYHMEHHRYQGYDNIDVDVPTYFEGYLLTTSSFGYVDRCIRKSVFLFFQIFGYAIRPMIIRPGLAKLDFLLFMNYFLTIAFDVLILAWLGKTGLMYLLLSTFFAGSIHPLAGHFIAEHYTFEGTTETYSYYGPLNRVSYNVGYHNEHHDFPNIAWSKLALVRKIAPEFYENLPECKSWPGILIQYIFDDRISPFSRVKRATEGAPAAHSSAGSLVSAPSKQD
jgi:sphingolipid delta-4 desaturase